MPSQETYIVKKGDTLWGISQHYGVDANEIARVNGLVGEKKHLLRVGQTIQLPPTSSDTELTIRLLDLAFRPLPGAELKLEYDGKTVDLTADADATVGPVFVVDHAKGLKVYYRQLDGKYALIAKHTSLPIGRKRLTLTSRKMEVDGSYWSEDGKQRKASSDVTQEARTANSGAHLEPGAQQPRATPAKPAEAAKTEAATPTTKPADEPVAGTKHWWDPYTGALTSISDWWNRDDSAPVTPAPATTTPQPVQQRTRVEGGTAQHAVSTVFTEKNLRLSPPNEKYRKVLIEVADKHGLTPHALAALVNAEASQLKSGEWNANAKATTSSASGLTQFLDQTWLSTATDARSKVNQDLKAKHGYTQVNGRWVGKSYKLYGKKDGKDVALDSGPILALRFIPDYSIDAAAVYGLMNLDALAKAGLGTAGLAPEDLAKVMYIAHHEGAGGAAQVLKGTITNARAKELLPIQVGKVKAAELGARFKEDYRQAYTHWLYTYIDAKINVTVYMVEPGKLKPKPMSDVAKSLGGKGSAIPPKPAAAPATKPAAAAPAAKPAAAAPAAKPAAAAPAAKPAAAPAAKPAAAAPEQPSGVGAAAGWHDPLASCVVRTAGLASARSATFGKVRKNADGTPKNHQGVDFVASPGTDIFAVANGRVTSLSRAFKDTKNYGATIILSVDVKDLPEKQRKLYQASYPKNKEIHFFYAHLSRIDVTMGKDKVCLVKAGDKLGATGSSGNAHSMTTIAKGAHLHFEARHTGGSLGVGLTGRMDPLPYIAKYTMPTK